MITYNIPVWNFPTLEKKLQKMQRKIAKLGREFTYIVGEEFSKKYTRFDSLTNETITSFKNFIPVTMNEIDFRHTHPETGEAWTLCAQLEHMDNGNFIAKIADCEIPKEYWTCGQKCDECNKGTHRNCTYLVRHNDEWKQVGGQCVKSYTGLDPNKLAAFAKLEKEIKGFSEEGEFFSLNDGPEYAGLGMYLSIVTAYAKTFGWARTSAAHDYENPRTPTCELAWDAYFNTEPNKDGLTILDRLKVKMESKGMSFSDCEVFADKAMEWAQSLSEEQRKENTFLFNIWVLSGLQGVDSKRKGLAAAIYAAYQRHLSNEERAKIEANKPVSEFVGKLGEFLYLQDDKKNKKQATLTLTYQRHFDGDWGAWTLQLFADEHGNELKYAGGSPAQIEVGQTLDKKKVFIRGYSEYQNKKTGKSTKQTVIGWRKGKLLNSGN